MSDPQNTSGDPGTQTTVILHRPDAVSTLPMGVRAEGMRQQVGRYMVGKRLGRGGMASVFEAHDPEIDRVIALKFLHPEYCTDDAYRARFVREARAAGKLSHPNIVTIYDVGEIEGRPFIAMELVQGEPLNELIKRKGVLAQRDVLEIALQLARALDYAHGKGLVHRDIKPANIMQLTDAHNIKVMDFGIAHFESADLDVTRVGDVLGTPQYMSPEQALGQPVDGRSDLFSVGIVLYYLLSGQVPFQDHSMVALGIKIANEPPMPLEQLRPDIDLPVRRIVMRCLEKDPAERFQSGSELAAAIQDFLEELSEQTRPRQPPTLLPLKLKWAAVMSAIVLVVMSLTSALIYRQQHQALVHQMSDFGAALGRLIAAESAVDALDDEWAPVEVLVQEIMKSGDLVSLVVLDSKGYARAASDASLVDKPYVAPAGIALEDGAKGVKVRRYQIADTEVIGFSVPILFQDKRVGAVELGISEQPLERLGRLSLWLMVLLVLVTVSAAGMAMYFITEWFAGPARVLRHGLRELMRDQLDYRVDSQRQDEFGLLLNDFNQLAERLQQRAMPKVGAVAGSAGKPSSETELP